MPNSAQMQKEKIIYDHSFNEFCGRTGLNSSARARAQARISLAL